MACQAWRVPHLPRGAQQESRGTGGPHPQECTWPTPHPGSCAATTRPPGPQPCFGMHGGHRQPTGVSPRPPRPAVRSAVRVGVADTDPDSSTTGAWSKPFSRRISMVCSQVTVGSTVSGADRLSSWTRRCHHLSDSAERAVNRGDGRRGPGARALWPHGGLWGRRSSPRLGHCEVLLLQEALLQHPLVAQELGPAGIRGHQGLHGGSRRSSAHTWGGTRRSESPALPTGCHGPVETPPWPRLQGRGTPVGTRRESWTSSDPCPCLNKGRAQQLPSPDLGQQAPRGPRGTSAPAHC